jgi:hypothetical protein
MPTIIEFPTVVRDAVEEFAPMFQNERQRKHFGGTTAACCPGCSLRCMDFAMSRHDFRSSYRSRTILVRLF